MAEDLEQICIDISSRPLGIIFTHINTSTQTTLYLREVFEDSIAQKIGLKVGDTLSTINGISVTDLSMPEALLLFRTQTLPFKALFLRNKTTSIHCNTHYDQTPMHHTALSYETDIEDIVEFDTDIEDEYESDSDVDFDDLEDNHVPNKPPKIPQSSSLSLIVTELDVTAIDDEKNADSNLSSDPEQEQTYNYKPSVPRNPSLLSVHNLHINTNPKTPRKKKKKKFEKYKIQNEVYL